MFITVHTVKHTTFVTTAYFTILGIITHNTVITTNKEIRTYRSVFLDPNSDIVEENSADVKDIAERVGYSVR